MKILFKKEQKMKDTNKGAFNRENYIDFIVSRGVAGVKKVTLKSGKNSNLFFNFGVIDDIADQITLGEFFSDYIHENYKNYDAIYGPAYKGISIALMAAAALYRSYSHKVKVLYDRKEEKIHGEEGSLIGTWKKDDRVLMLDDVFTDGATKREAVYKLNAFGLEVTGVLVGIDREEMHEDGLTCSHEFSDASSIGVLSLCKKSDILR
jgi:orotate phosphoribosyltransferase